jgi:hypothetical protein
MEQQQKNLYILLLTLEERIAELDRTVIDDIKDFDRFNNHDQNLFTQALRSIMKDLPRSDSHEELFYNVIDAAEFSGKELIKDKFRLSLTETDEEKKELVNKILDKTYYNADPNNLDTFYKWITRIAIRLKDQDIKQKVIKKIDEI